MLTIEGFLEELRNLHGAYKWEVTKRLNGKWALRAIREETTWDNKILKRSYCPITAVMHSKIMQYVPSWEYARHCDRIGLRPEDAIVIACAADGYKAFAELGDKLREAAGVGIS